MSVSSGGWVGAERHQKRPSNIDARREPDRSSRCSKS
jgi:hypothetical protein